MPPESQHKEEEAFLNKEFIPKMSDLLFKDTGYDKSFWINKMKDNRPFIKSLLRVDDSVLRSTTEFTTTDKDNLRVDYYSQVDGLTGELDDDIINKIQTSTESDSVLRLRGGANTDIIQKIRKNNESADETIKDNCAILKNDQIGLSTKEKNRILNANVRLKRFKVLAKIWQDNLMSEDRSKDADIYKFKDKSKVEMKNETATEEIFQ